MNAAEQLFVINRDIAHCEMQVAGMEVRLTVLQAKAFDCSSTKRLISLYWRSLRSLHSQRYRVLYARWPVGLANDSL
jgi:hypothetical protein